jgi:probable DNA repair protein
MSSFDPVAALAAGVTVVTPNNRLARTLIARHDAAMLRSRRRTWTAARALPWSIWLTTLWRDALEAGVAPPELRVLSQFESQYLWRRLVRDDEAQQASVIDSRGAAQLALDAWQLVHAWGEGGQSWRGWRDSAEAPEDSDAAAFVRWAERHHRDLASRRGLDLATLPDALREWAGGMREWRGRTVALVGFLEFSPQQQRLHDALAAAGMTITVAPAPATTSTVYRAVATTSRDEVRAALSWARARAIEAPDDFIGIAIEDLAARRDDVRALAEDVLCPRLQLPGHAFAPRPYDLSLGKPLAEQPLVASALSLVALAHAPLPRSDAAALMRSPFLPGSWLSRASCERDWIEAGRNEVVWADVRSLAPAARDAEALSRKRARTPHEWTAQWRSLLDRCGWPTELASTGVEYEVRQAWERLLDDFARLGHVEAQLDGGNALDVLRDMAARVIFQSESPPASIAIMGFLEAAALPFDALWVAGLSAQRWPPPARPNPLLPLRWQHERNVPRSSAARERGYAEVLTRHLARSAPIVVMSAPGVIEDYESAPSALIDAQWPQLAPLPDAIDSAQRIGQARDLESMADERAPALASGAAPGGAGAIAAQSTCPFQATARYRLRAEPWPAPAEALSYAERGQLVHAMMAAFWLDVRTHDELHALDAKALDARIERAAAAARAQLPEARWRLLPPAVAQAEALRISQIASIWLRDFEWIRPPFTVERIEATSEVRLAGLVFRVKLDRVDRLTDGSFAVIDYKTGAVDGPRTWFGPRPRSPQLGVYALALQMESPPIPVSAVAYARVKAGEIAVFGITARKANWPKLADAEKQRDPSGWSGIEAFWQQRLPELAAELRDGVATVTPRDPRTVCRVCRRHALCRIGARGLGETDEGDDGAR